MPMDKSKYPANWRDISLSIRMDRAKGQCEWTDEQGNRCQRCNGDGRTVLTVMHLDHNPMNCDPSNLRAACQMHHLRYDAELHAQHAAETRRRKRAALQPALFEEMEEVNE